MTAQELSAAIARMDERQIRRGVEDEVDYAKENFSAHWVRLAGELAQTLADALWTDMQNIAVAVSISGDEKVGFDVSLGLALLVDGHTLSLEIEQDEEADPSEPWAEDFIFLDPKTKKRVLSIRRSKDYSIRHPGQPQYEIMTFNRDVFSQMVKDVFYRPVLDEPSTPTATEQTAGDQNISLT